MYCKRLTRNRGREGERERAYKTYRPEFRNSLAVSIMIMRIIGCRSTPLAFAYLMVSVLQVQIMMYNDVYKAITNLEIWGLIRISCGQI
jgi:hypothetical protein